MSETTRIYFNGVGVDAPAGASVIEALEIAKQSEADAVRNGERVITDSRGLPADPAGIIYNGAIFRLRRARPRDHDKNS
jgi:hypothetical protein